MKIWNYAFITKFMVRKGLGACYQILGKVTKTWMSVSQPMSMGSMRGIFGGKRHCRSTI